MRKLLMIVAVVGLVAYAAAPAGANTVASSTMYFQGTLTDEGGGIYTGTIDATAGTYYAPGGPGTTWDGSQWVTPDGNPAVGGFDVFARQGATTYVDGYSQSGITIGSDHDAYPSNSAPWGAWWDPDCPDWGSYSLELTADHWYLRYTATQESPMSGTMDWTNMFAAETDLGTQDGGHDGSAAHGGGGGAWDWDCGWGVEVIPLEYNGFVVEIKSIKGEYQVSLTPAPEPASVIVWGLLGAGCAGGAVWRRRRRPAMRAPWTEESRQAIRQIIERGRLNR